MDASTIGGRRASGARNGRAARTRGADPPPFLSPPSPQLDVDLLCRLLWLSSWPAPGTPEAPCWTQAHPSLTALDLSSAAWTPTPAHPAPNLRRVLQACPGLVELRATGLRRGGGGGKGDRPSLALRFDAGDALLLAAEAATHPSIRTIAIDVGARLGDGDARPLAALLGGAPRVRARELALAAPTANGWRPARDSLRDQAGMLGTAAAEGGWVSRLTLDSVAPAEAVAAAVAALPSPSLTHLHIVVGASDAGWPAAWAAVAAAAAAAPALGRVSVCGADARTVAPLAAACAAKGIALACE